MMSYDMIQQERSIRLYADGRTASCYAVEARTAHTCLHSEQPSEPNQTEPEKQFQNLYHGTQTSHTYMHAECTVLQCGVV